VDVWVQYCNNFLKRLLHVVGDDDGRIQLWDLRQAEAVGSFAEHTDYISDMAAHTPERTLLACSGDGTLSVNDLRTFKVAKAQTLNQLKGFRFRTSAGQLCGVFRVGSLPVVEGAVLVSTCTNPKHPCLSYMCQ
jgi:WD40 repeat protein